VGGALQAGYGKIRGMLSRLMLADVKASVFQNEPVILPKKNMRCFRSERSCFGTEVEAGT